MQMRYPEYKWIEYFHYKEKRPKQGLSSAKVPIVKLSEGRGSPYDKLYDIQYLLTYCLIYGHWGPRLDDDEDICLTIMCLHNCMYYI